MNEVGGFTVCGMSFFWGAKVTKAVRPSRDAYLGDPCISIRPKADALESALVVFAHARVGTILGVGGYAQVCDSVVRSVLVSVVDLIGRPFPVHVKPCKPMGEVSAIKYSDAPVPISDDGSRFVANLYSVAYAF